MGYLRFLSNRLTLIPQLYRESQLVTTSRNLNLDDGGKFLVCNGSAAITLTLPSLSWRDDTEIEILHWSTNSVFIAASGVTITRFGGTTHQIAGRGCCAILKLITTNDWVLFGGFL